MGGAVWRVWEGEGEGETIELIAYQLHPGGRIISTIPVGSLCTHGSDLL